MESRILAVAESTETRAVPITTSDGMWGVIGVGETRISKWHWGQNERAKSSAARQRGQTDGIAQGFWKGLERVVNF
jgi:hypothetical protein